MKGQLYINGKDAYTTWGVLMDTETLSALMTPPPQKELVKNKCRLVDGVKVTEVAARTDARDITLTLQLVAKTEQAFFAQYQSLCEELSKGAIEIKTVYQPGIVYRCYYQSCTQFTQYMRGIAKFSLKLNEPDPTNRNG